ncbi:MAG: ABC transporter substrate-binding protein [Gammaproteobacteria bacterium]|nr:ABC transporter substrate-binding protein [Gammaproteobacteria bacterium]MCP5195428.1 ABC transporter substrate-binding protein [Gammaproteobacteria bacterium]
MSRRYILPLLILLLISIRSVLAVQPLQPNPLRQEDQASSPDSPLVAPLPRPEQALGKGGERRFRILMLLWRGETEVEAGFKSYLEERHLPFDLIMRSAGQDPTRIPALVAEARQLQPDLVYTWGTSLTLGVVGPYDQVDPARYLTEVPVVFTMVAYPVESRIVPAFTSSGRRVTGTTHTVPVEAQIKAIRAYRPMKRLAVLYNPTEPNSVINIGELRRAARDLDFELLAEPVPLNSEGRPDPEVLPALMDQLAVREPQFLYLGPDTFIGEHRQTLAGEALRHHLPVFAATERPIFDSAITLGLVAPYRHLGRFTAFKVEQILLGGQAPQTIPIETLHRFTYFVKLPVARQLNLYPPLAILNYAEVLE